MQARAHLHPGPTPSEVKSKIVRQTLTERERSLKKKIEEKIVLFGDSASSEE